VVVSVCVLVVCVSEGVCECVRARHFSQLPNQVIHLHEIGYEHYSYIGGSLVSHIAILYN